MIHTSEEIFSRIGNLLQEINADYARINQAEGQTNAMDVAFVAAKSRFLVSHFEMLQHLSTATVQADLSVPAAPVETSVSSSPRDTAFFTPPSMLVAQEKDKQPTQEEIVEVEPTADEQPNEEHARQEELSPTAAEDTVAVPALESSASAAEESLSQQHEIVEPLKVVSLPIVEAVAATTTIPSRPLTLNEMLQQQKSQDAAPMRNASAEKITDLKVAINLNDKLTFIKDLFNGYSLAYSEAIELLNRYTSFAEADAFLQTNYALKNNWAAKPQAVEKLYAILHKKFSI